MTAGDMTPNHAIPRLKNMNYEQFMKYNVQNTIQSKEDFEKAKQSLLDAQNKVPVDNLKSSPKKPVKIILQSEYTTSSSKTDASMLGTYGINTCTGVAIYDKFDGDVAIAHFDLHNDPYSLTSIKNKLSSNNGKNSSQCGFDVQIFGSSETHTPTMLDMAHIIQNDSEMNLESVHLTKENLRGVAIERDTGKTFHDPMPSKLVSHLDSEGNSRRQKGLESYNRRFLGLDPQQLTYIKNDGGK